MIKQLLIFLMVITGSFASSFGVVSKINGEAFFTINKNKKTLQVGDKLLVGGFVHTGDKSRIVIKFDKNVIVLGEKSQLKLDKKDYVVQKSGNIFYNISAVAKKISKEKFRIKTKTATIGIRGTNFIVDSSNKDEKILLREGKLNIASVDAEFKMYIKKEMDEFEAYKTSLEKEFKEFVDTNEHEFAAYKKEFELESNKFVYMKDGKVYQEEFSEEVEEMFENFDEFIED
ncbi:MAG: FecR family protein [Campylobacterales bacterium]|nr:FecR family protein [Campylobacterales bacterium]